MHAGGRRKRDPGKRSWPAGHPTCHLMRGGDASRGDKAMRRTILVPLVIIAAMVGCGRTPTPSKAVPAATATVSGRVFVTMKSGDVKRGADVAVALVPATPAFDEEWQAIVQDFEKSLEEAIAASREAYSASEDADQRWVAPVESRGGYYKSEEEDARRRQAESAHQQASIAGRAVSDVWVTYRARGDAMLRARASVSVRTDVN